MNILDSFENLPSGRKRMASARLRRAALRALNEALEKSGLSQSELARSLGKSRSAVGQVLNGDGNLKIETVSEYLFTMGAELQLSVVPLEQASYTAYKGWGTESMSLTNSAITSNSASTEMGATVFQFSKPESGRLQRQGVVSLDEQIGVVA